MHLGIALRSKLEDIGRVTRGLTVSKTNLDLQTWGQIKEYEGKSEA